MHGAVLRVESPDDCKTYMVDPGFPKRADAKIAVCLLAMSQGVGKYIRDLSEEVSNKISPEMRQTAIQSIIPLIASEYAKIWPEKCPDPYQFYRERDGMIPHHSAFVARSDHRLNSYRMHTNASPTERRDSFLEGYARIQTEQRSQNSCRHTSFCRRCHPVPAVQR